MTTTPQPDPLETAIGAAAWALVESSGADWCTPSPDTRKHAAAAVRAAAPHIERDALLRMADEIDRGPTFPLPPSVISALVRERAEAVGTEERHGA